MAAERQPSVGWAETRRLIALDLEGYGVWLPELRASWPAWARFAYVLCKTQIFPANVLYRLQTYFYGIGLGAFAALLSRLNLTLYSVGIGRDVRIGGGLHLVHGQVVIDGTTTLGRGVSIAPFVSVGLTNASGAAFDLKGPRVGDEVHIGTGARLLGPIRVGDRARIGANAVVLADVPDDHTAVGIPARSLPPTIRLEAIDGGR